MGSEPAQDDRAAKAESADREALKRRLNDPEVQARIKRAFEDAKAGRVTPGVTAEEMPEFLREFE